MKKTFKKVISVVTSIALCAGFISYLPTVTMPEEVNAAVTQKVNVGVDFNGSDNRADLRSEIFEDWIVGNCQEATYEYEEGGLTFTVKNATKDGAGYIYSDAKKNLVNATGISPVLTADGLRCSTFKNSAITLEIKGLPAGTHTITSWHSTNWVVYKDASLAVSINGEVVEDGLLIAGKVSDDNDATITYNSFEVAEGETAVITFATENLNISHSVMVLNAFEIDGVHPLKSIKNALPEDKEDHFELEDGLSWTAAEGAKAHRLYIGTDEYTVSVATRDFPEYQGKELTECSYDILNECKNIKEFDHMKTYYWRVDEVFEDGTVVTGKVYSFNVTHLAFPTAEGYGRFATGGRGGQVITVTTLEDGYKTVVDAEGNPVISTDADGNPITATDDEGNPVVDENGNPVYVYLKAPIEGSLRWAIESFTGPRTVVFNVGGAINLVDKLTIDADHGEIYVAGQTAPGGGITINNYTFGAMGAEDVIIRDVRVRIGDISGQSMGGMGLGGCDNSIIDHCSIAWATDEGFSSRNAKNITFQRNIIAESLNNSVHYAGSDDGSADDRVEGATERHSFAASVGGKIASLHHNLLINNTGRNWSMAGGVESDGSYAGYLDIRNNVVYNWQNRTTDGGALRVNFIGNFYKMGAVSRDMDIFYIDGDELDNVVPIKDSDGNPILDENGKYTYRSDAWQQAYLEGNKMIDRDGNILLDPVLDDPWEKATAGGKNMEDANDSKSLVPFFGDSYITEHTADDAYDSVVADVGATVPSWDYLDSRYIKEVTEGSYTLTGSKDGLPGIIDSQEDAGGYPDENDIEYATRPEGFDTDLDGMPDEWETLHSLDPANPADGSVITLSAEGYTNLEMYLCELMNDPLDWKNEDQKPDPTATPKPAATATPEVPAATATPEVPAVELGDINGDKNINAQDALAVLKHAAKIAVIEGDALTAADVNKDSNVNAQDALGILKFAAHIISSFDEL